MQKNTKNQHKSIEQKDCNDCRRELGLQTRGRSSSSTTAAAAAKTNTVEQAEAGRVHGENNCTQFTDTC